MSARWAALVVRGRWLVLAAWVATVVVTSVSLPTIREAQVGALGDLVPRDAEAIDAEIRSAELFRFPLLSRTVVVQRDPEGLSAEAQARVGARAVALNGRIWPRVDGIAGAAPITNTLGRPPFSRERSTTALTFLFFPPEIGQVGRNGLAQRLVEEHVSEPGDAVVGVTGAIPARAEQARLVTESLPAVELATVVLVALVVGLFFRALGPPLLTLAAVAVAYLVAIRAVAGVGRAAGVSVPSEVQPVIVVLLFGVITDYTIFFLARFRRRLAEGLPPHEAARLTTSALAPTVLAAGCAVVFAGAALAVAELGFLQAFGPGIAMATIVAVAVSLTLVPAAMAILGHRLFWPRPASAAAPAATTETTRAAEPPRRRGIVDLAVRRPWAVTAACLLVLLACASGLPRMEAGNPLMRGLPADSDVRQAYQAAKRGFTPGLVSPIVVIVERPGITSDRRALARLQRLLKRRRGIAEAVGPADQPLPSAVGAALSPTGDAARYLLVSRTDPLGAVAIRRLGRLREALPGLVAEAGLGDAKASVAGDTALAAETVDLTLEDTARVVPAVLLVLFAVLAVFLRALVAPLYLLAANVLSVASALGLTVYVFQDLLYGEITYFVPFAAAVLLAALGSDYTIFLAGRVWEEARRLPLRDAVVVGASRASTSIAVAGGVLAGSFALLALVPVRPFRELAFTMAVGLVIDAFLVRPLLVPAMIQLVGRRSAWPSRLAGDGARPPADGTEPRAT